MAYQIEAIPMTLSHLQAHFLLQAFQCDFSYSYAAVDKILADSASRGLSAVCGWYRYCFRSHSK